MDLRRLDLTQLPVLHAAYLEAFSDYSVPVRPTLAQFGEMLCRRGVDWPHSVGAFEGENLVGVQIIGTGEYGFEGTLSAYNLLTGVVPSARGKQLGKALIGQALESLGASPAEQILLECVQSNKVALDLYRDLGFQVTRSLECLDVPGEKLVYKQIAANVSIREITSPVWVRLGDHCTWSPSWQNSNEAMRRARPKPTVLGAYRDDAIVGYAALFQESGDLAQFTVHPGKHHEGIGSALFAACARRLIPGVNRIRIMNVPSDAEEDLDFFRARGAELITKQFELRRPI
ncbi:MAG: ribosomal protein S18 acetylase RimI-like enzyme [Planctomycetota bacterium]|jgi:ribosomal protein S18 acetylase RimI-like enzyme